MMKKTTNKKNISILQLKDILCSRKDKLEEILSFEDNENKNKVKEEIDYIDELLERFLGVR